MPTATFRTGPKDGFDTTVSCKQFCFRVLTGCLQQEGSFNPSWGGPESFLERHGAFGERLGSVLERPGSVLGRLGAVLVALKVVLDDKMSFESAQDTKT